MSSSVEKTPEQEKQPSSGYQEDLDHLRQSPLFQRIDPDCLKLLVMLCKRIEFVKDDQLITQGEDDGHAYLITSGRVSVRYSDGDDHHVIREYRDGDLIGGCSLLGRMTRIFTVQATEQTTALRLSRDDFQKVMKQFPDNVPKVTASLIAALTDWDRILLETQLSDERFDPRTFGVSLL